MQRRPSLQVVGKDEDGLMGPPALGGQLSPEASGTLEPSLEAASGGRGQPPVLNRKPSVPLQEL